MQVLAVKQESRGVGELGNREGERVFGQGLEGVGLRRPRLVHGHGVWAYGGCVNRGGSRSPRKKKKQRP
ncbi:hypothetical protein TB1_005054 [Malus domestica]